MLVRGGAGLVPDFDFQMEKRMCFLFAVLGFTQQRRRRRDHGGRRGKEEENEDRFWRRHAASDFLSTYENNTKKFVTEL